jgi:hypothetical protein
MSTTVKTGRAWVPAIVTTLLGVVALFGCGLAREILVDRGVSALTDPDSLVGTYVYRPLAPVGSPGIVGDADFAESIAQLGGGLVPVVILVFLFTWLAARAARAGSAFTVLLGAWLGTVLGVGLGALTAYQVFLWQNDDLADALVGLEQVRLDRLGSGLYWGAIAGLLLGLVAMLVWLIVRPRAAEPEPEPDPGADQSPPDVASYPPPGQHAMPARASDETVQAPKPSSDDTA